MSHGKQVALKVVFCSLAAANGDDGGDAWAHKTWEDRGVQVVAHHLWARCRESECPPREGGTEGTGRMSDQL